MAWLSENWFWILTLIAIIAGTCSVMVGTVGMAITAAVTANEVQMAKGPAQRRAAPGAPDFAQFRPRVRAMSCEKTDDH